MYIAVIGCGVMGSAFARHFAKKHSVLLCDRDEERAGALAKEIGGVYHKSVSQAVKEADVVLLAVKPKDLSTIAADVSAFSKGKIVMSILAGTSVAALKPHFPTAIVVRAMPNLGMLCEQGVTGLVDDAELSAEAKKKVEAIMEGAGLNLWLSENKLEAITALSGSGIGFIFVIIEAMIDGGIYLGFTSAESREIVLKTLEGAVALMRETGKHPAELKQQISSPGGTTAAGLKTMEEAGVRSGIIKTLTASHEKALKMAKEL